MQLQAIKSDRLYVKVAENLTQFIHDSALKPGQRLPSERELAERLGVSRPTIREAMIAMEISGIIEIRTGSGIYITEQSPKRHPQLDHGAGPFEILEMRLILETEACALAAQRISHAQIGALKDALEAMSEEEKLDDASEKADWVFHSVIAEATQNSAIYSAVNWLWELRNESELSTAFLSRLRDKGVHPSLDDHRAILAALEARDPNAARLAMRKHIENVNSEAVNQFEK